MNNNEHNVIAFPGNQRDGSDPSADEQAERHVVQIIERVEAFEHGQKYADKMVELVEQYRADGLSGAELFGRFREYLATVHPILLREVQWGRL